MNGIFLSAAHCLIPRSTMTVVLRVDQKIVQLTAIVFAILFPLSSLALDVSRPAHVRVVVCDDQGGPLRGVQVQFSGPSPHWPAKGPPPVMMATDAEGAVAVERLRPPDSTAITWNEHAHVELDGYLPQRISLPLFPGAQIDHQIELESVRTTLIRLRGPQGEALSRVGFEISYVKGGGLIQDRGKPKFLFTNDDGECLWRHGTLPEGFHLSGRPEKERFQDAPIVTVVYKAGELPQTAPLLRGKLFNANGSSASDWSVARKVRFMGSGGISGSEPRNFMKVEDLIRVDAGGNFELDAEKYLILVSPEGVPFLHEIAPGTWLPGNRQITLRVPEQRTNHRGQIAYEDGSPVADLPVAVELIRANGQLWEIYADEDDRGFRKPLSGTRLTDGMTIGGIRTDAQGRFSVPTYYGTIPQFRVHCNGWALDDWNGIGTKPRNILKRDHAYRLQAPKNLDRIKQVTLVIEDERGNRFSNIQIINIDQFVAGERAHKEWTGGEDTRGRHLFLDSSIDRIEFVPNDWKRNLSFPKTTVEIPGTDDQVIHVVFDEDHRPRPLSGQVLNPDGSGVKRIRVSLYDADRGKKYLQGNDYLRLTTTTDEDGKFIFEAAPDECYIETGRSGDNSDANPPGWAMPTPINRQTREVQIKLQRDGSLKVLLPEGIGDDARGIFVQREKGPVDEPLRHRNVYLEHDNDRTVLLANNIRPGWYLFSNYQTESTEAFAALGQIRTEVRPGEQSVVDLRNRKMPERRATEVHPKSWVTVVVKHGNQVVSGAEVTVLTSVATTENLARWIAEASGDDPKLMKTATAMLKQAGAQAVDAIRANDDTPDRDKLLKQLGDVETDGLYRTLNDLTDDTGHVRCEVEQGRSCVAVARLRGRMIGWQAFDARDETVSVALRTTRTLVLRRKVARPKEDYVGPGLLRMEPPSEPGWRGLMSCLCEAREPMPKLGAWVNRETVFDHVYPMQGEGRSQPFVEDLPAGTNWTVALPNRSTEDDEKSIVHRRITIESGRGIQFVEW